MFRRTLLTSAALTAALGMTGCFTSLQSTDADQQDVIGDVTLTSKSCDLPFLAVLEGLPIGLPGQVEKAGRGLGPVGCVPQGFLEDLAQNDFPVGVPHQLLAAYRVPKGTHAPETVHGTVNYIPYSAFSDQQIFLDRGQQQQVETKQVTLEFTHDDAYGDQVPRYVDEDRGQGEEGLIRNDEDIAGYVSEVVPGVPFGEIEIKGDFGLPSGDAPDEPYQGPFNSLQLIGSRWAAGTEEEEQAFVDFFENLFDEVGPILNQNQLKAVRDARGVVYDFDELRPDRDVRCLDDLGNGGPPVNARSLRGDGGPPPIDIWDLLQLIGGFDFTDCGFPDWTKAQSQNDLTYNEVLEGDDQDTRDLRVIPGEGYGAQGTSAAVPFGLRTHGDSGDPSDALPWTATTNLPGVETQSGSVGFPGTGETPNPITIAIPADAAPGTYSVTLTVGHDKAQQTATSALLVLPKEDSEVQGSGDPSDRQEVAMNPDGTLNFIVPGTGGPQQGMVLASKNGISSTANTAAAKPRLLRITKKRSFKTKAGQSTTATLKLFPKAQRAVRKGKSIKAIFVTRKNGKGAPTVQKVLIRKK